MRALKTTTISILTIGLLAGSAAGVTAQTEEAAEPMTPAYVTGTAGEPASVVDGTFSEDNRVLRGLVLEGIPVEASDPRLSGLLDIVVNGHSEITDDGGAILESRLYRSVNDDGAWVGSGTYVEAWDADAEEPHIIRETFMATGEGAYEGLVAFVTADHLEDGPWEAVVIGVEVPPVPDAPVAD